MKRPLTRAWTAVVLVAAASMGCEVGNPGSDAGRAVCGDGGTLSGAYHSNHQCSATPPMPGNKLEGEACGSHYECKPTCCTCSGSANTYNAAACLGCKCASAAEACAFTIRDADSKVDYCGP